MYRPIVKKTFNVKFAQTTDKNTTKYISNLGMWPDAADPWGAETGFSKNFEICGVQLKESRNDPNNKALRFVSVIDQNLLNKAESYGYVIGYTKQQNLDTKTINRIAYTLVKDGDYGATVNCTGTDNTLFDDYGKHDTVKNYKYVTAAVNNLQESGDNGLGLDATIIARPFVELKSQYQIDGAPTVVYGQYVDISSGEAFCACSGSYNYINQLTNG